MKKTPDNFPDSIWINGVFCISISNMQSSQRLNTEIDIKDLNEKLTHEGLKDLNNNFHENYSVLFYDIEGNRHEIKFQLTENKLIINHEF